VTQYGQQEIREEIQDALALNVKSAVTVVDAGNNLFICKMPEDGVEFGLFVRNYNSTARGRGVESRGQVSVPQAIRDQVSALVAMGVPVIPLFLDKPSGMMIAGDPRRLTARLNDIIANYRTVSIAYTYDTYLTAANANGVAARLYTDGVQSVIHFQPKYLGWYLLNWEEAHRVDGRTEGEINRQLRADALAFVGQAPPAGSPLPSLKTGLAAPGGYKGKYGSGGESPAHKQLKYLSAGQPEAFGLSASAVPYVETGFAAFVTGDHVDVYFRGGGADATVVEVELSGQSNITTGIHQAAKYRTLAASRAGILFGPGQVDYRAAVVAHDVDYAEAKALAAALKIGLYQANMANHTIHLVQGVA